MKQVAFFVALAVGLVGCGGGGGGDGGGGGACSDLNVRVFGGDTCNASASPVVPLYAFDSNGTVIGTCTATLITVQHALTAAHCAELTHLPGVALVAAYADKKLNAVVAGVNHPNYHGQTGSPYDLAVVTLEERVPIGPVPLLLSRNTAIGDQIAVFGYGRNEDPTDSPKDFRAAYMTIAGFNTGHFGATFDDTQTSVCHGDSGGPATEQLNGVTGIVGITSFGINGCQGGSISGFVDIQYPVLFNFILAAAPASVI